MALIVEHINSAYSVIFQAKWHGLTFDECETNLGLLITRLPFTTIWTDEPIREIWEEIDVTEDRHEGVFMASITTFDSDCRLWNWISNWVFIKNAANPLSLSTINSMLTNGSTNAAIPTAIPPLTIQEFLHWGVLFELLNDKITMGRLTVPSFFWREFESILSNCSLIFGVTGYSYMMKGWKCLRFSEDTFSIEFHFDSQLPIFAKTVLFFGLSSIISKVLNQVYINLFSFSKGSEFTIDLHNASLFSYFSNNPPLDASPVENLADLQRYPAKPNRKPLKYQSKRSRRVQSRDVARSRAKRQKTSSQGSFVRR